jgi:hypothetical protein
MTIIASCVGLCLGRHLRSLSGLGARVHAGAPPRPSREGRRGPPSPAPDESHLPQVPYRELVRTIAPERWRCSENFTENGRRIVAQAHLQAYTHHSDHVGTEHVLLALVDGQHDPLVSLLRRAGVSPDEVRDRVEEAIGPPGTPRAAHLPYSPHVKRALASSLRRAQQSGGRLIDLEHIVGGLFSQPDSAAAKFVADLGVDPGWMSQQAVSGDSSPDRPRTVS